MPVWNPSSQYRKVAEANRQYYAKTAHMYEATETCVTSPRSQQMLEQDIDEIIRLINKPPAMIRALDACGGSGNVSLKLLHRQISVTTCDISPDLLTIFRGKCSAHGLSPQIVCAEIGSFLQTVHDTYDLIIFSSALHHLEDITGVLTLAHGRLRPGGLLYTVFDPTTPHIAFTRKMLWIDYIAFKLLKQTNDLGPSITRRLQRTFGRSSAHLADKTHLVIDDANLGVLAEYHVEQGIDDMALVNELTQIGFEVVWHQRSYGARYALTRSFLNWLRDATAFKLLLRKSVDA